MSQEFKDHIVQHPNRFKQTTVAPGVVELTPTWVENPSEVVQAGTPVDRQLFNGITSQLAETTKQLKHQAITPLYIETLASFSWMGTGVPTGVANYTGGNYTLTVNGVAGNNYLTVTAGNIADAGTTSKWAAVLAKPDSSYEGYRVTGTDGINKVYVYPNVRENITGATLGNLHDADQGQHYTALGYKAFGQHIYKAAGYYSQRLSYIARFIGSDDNGDWSSVGTPTAITYNRGLHPVDLTDGLLEGDREETMTFDTDAAGEGLEWAVSTDKRIGYFEGFIGIVSGGGATVEFYIDDILQTSQVVPRELTRLVFDFNFGRQAKVRIVSNSATATTVRVGNCYFWATEKVTDNVFEGKSKAVYLGDSWGTYHNAANPTEIQRMWQLANPNAQVVNRSAGGMTTKYGRAWFEEYVLNEQPDIVVIEYFTNDINTILTGTGLSFTDPDGQTQSGVVTQAEYYDNLRYMIDTAVKHNIQPIVVLPAAVAGDTQTQYHARYAARLATGGSVTPTIGNFESVTAEDGSIVHMLTDGIETKTPFNSYLELLTSSWGARIKPRVMLYDGTLLTIANNDDTPLFKVGFDATGIGGQMTTDTIELTGIYAEQGMLWPKSHIVDNANVLKIKQRAGATLDAIEIGEGTDKVVMKAPLEMFVTASLPTASLEQRGQVVRVEGGIGVADKVYMCIKNASNTYEWKEL